MSFENKDIMTIKRWMKQIICLVTIFSLLSISVHVYVSPSFFSTCAEEMTPSISIENVQSYPKVGGEWTVSFTVKGTANLTITTVNGTTWNAQSEKDCDLIFKHIKNLTKTFDTIWKNNSVLIRNFSSNTVVSEVSEVNTLGKHVLKFTFGTETVFAFNDASNWWNNTWGYRKKITINHSQVEGSLKDFPILLNITDNDLRGKAEDDGKDIAFISYIDNSSSYSHEIEQYSDGNLTAWIKIPRITSIENTSFWMYYNNSECTNQENPTEVWNNNFMMVQHLNETNIDGDVDDIKDSSIKNNDATTANMDSTDQVTGKINGSFDFDGINDHVYGNLSSNPITDQFTISDWISVSSLNDQYNHVSLGNGTGGIRVVPYIDSSNTINCYYGNDSDATVLSSDVKIISVDTWYHITCTYNATDLSIYVNGRLRNSSMMSYSMIENDYVIGADISKGTFFHQGKIDEVRISNTARNESWIQTSYNTVQNQSIFLTLDSEESAAPDLSNPNPVNGNENVANTPDYFEITVFDPNPDLLNITWRTNQSGIWETFNITNGTGNGVADGTYQVVNTSWVDTFDQPYFWSVNVTDGVHWTNETYTFTMHQYNPIINSFNLSNETGCKLNNRTGNIDVGKEYIFSMNVTDKNGWNDINYINLSCWFDTGDDASVYNQTEGGNYNLKIQYKNITEVAQYLMLWPDDESDLVIGNCSETIINQTTRIINLSFIPGNQTRCATSNQTWTAIENLLDDLYSWNLNCTITDSSINTDYYENEYGVNWHSTITAPNLVEITGAPGMIEEANEDFPITFTCNSDYELVIYLETNLTQIGGSDIIALKDNLRLLATADASDDIIEDTNFSGSGENHSITLENTTAPENNEQRTINTRFELTIPFGTWGTYSAKIVKKIYRR